MKTKKQKTVDLRRLVDVNLSLVQYRNIVASIFGLPPDDVSSGYFYCCYNDLFVDFDSFVYGK